MRDRILLNPLRIFFDLDKTRLIGCDFHVEFMSNYIKMLKILLLADFKENDSMFACATFYERVMKSFLIVIYFLEYHSANFLSRR